MPQVMLAEGELLTLSTILPLLEYKTATSSDYETREFDPYHIICQKGSWYLLGFSHSSQAIRLYAMPRIRKCEITEKSLPCFS